MSNTLNKNAVRGKDVSTAGSTLRRGSASRYEVKEEMM